MEHVEDIVRLSNQGILSRREFIRRLSVFGLAAAAIPSVFTAKTSVHRPEKTENGRNHRRSAAG